MTHSRLRHPRRRALPAALLLACLSVSGAALAGATGGVIVRGIGTIANPDANTTTVTINTANQVVSGSRTSLVTWSSFDVNAGQTVNFNNATSNPLAVINYVPGSGTASQINGAINAPSVGGNNTSVLIVNPQGVNIGSTAVINTSGAFIAASGSLNTEGVNANAPSGALSINLSQKAFVTIDTGASITTGNSQGVGSNVAFMSYGQDTPQGQLYDSSPATSNVVALPYINDQGTSPWNFYVNVDNASNYGRYYLTNFSLAGSSAVYQFNGQQTALHNLDFGATISNPDAYFGSGPNQTALQNMSGVANLGNATFQAAPGSYNSLFVESSGLQGGHFLVTDPQLDFEGGGFNRPSLILLSSGTVTGVDAKTAHGDMVVSGTTVSGGHFSADDGMLYFTITDWVNNTASANDAFLYATTVEGGSIHGTNSVTVSADSVDGLTTSTGPLPPSSP
jgi:filamentous hemagglutinin family protein